MKVLVTGSNGQLGCDVVKALESRGDEFFCAGREDLNVTDAGAVLTCITDYRPEAVIHCAAYTAVDRAEKDVVLCRAVNVDGSRNVARACVEVGAKMIYIGTDYVFLGNGDKAYETGDPKEPLNIYGKAKLDGENAVREAMKKYFIVRVSWLFGASGNNFVRTMLRLGKERDELDVVCDQIGSPTYTVDLAPLLCSMAATERFGVYHATNEGFCSRADFAREIFRQAGYQTKVQNIPTMAYPTMVRRPLNSRLSKKSLDLAGFSRLPPWQDAVHRFLSDMSER